jgi:L,D-transpeptidase ErfK/SrfK
MTISQRSLNIRIGVRTRTTTQNYRITIIMRRYLLVLLGTLPIAGNTAAVTFQLPPADVDVVGQVEYTEASREDTLLDIARKYDIGQNEILLANPKVDRWLPANGARVTIPNRYILPNAERNGLVLNLPEMRLYYYPKPVRDQQQVVITHPVSVGRMDWVTPLGTTKIVAKERDPSWRPPKSLKEEHAKEGDILPDVVPPGPDNPLGRFAMRLGFTGYLIHSTNKPFGVGMRVSHGCIRMYPEDIEQLFDQVPVGTKVQLVNQPIKVGWLAGALFMEVHPPMDEDRDKYQDIINAAFDSIADAIAGSGNEQHVALSGSAIKAAVEEQSGIPVMISK